MLCAEWTWWSEGEKAKGSSENLGKERHRDSLAPATFRHCRSITGMSIRFCRRHEEPGGRIVLLDTQALD